MIWRRRIFTVVVIIIVGLTASFFLFRNAILRKVFETAQARVHEHYHASLKIASFTFSGLDKVTITGLVLQPDGADTFLQMGRAEFNISLINLCRAKVVLDRIKVNGAAFTIYNEEGRNNISFLKPRKKTTSASSTLGFRERALDLENQLFRALHTAFEAQDVKISYQDSTINGSLYIPVFSYDLHTLSGTLINQRNADTISINGTVVKKNESYQCTISQLGNDSLYLPFLDRDHGLQCRFHTISADVRFYNTDAECKISTDAILDDFHINHWRLAKEDVTLPHAQFKGVFTFTDDAIEMDSISSIELGSASCHMFARFDLRPDTTFRLGLHMPDVVADSFFQALPGGMFGTLRGISCTGTLAYDLAFAIHTDNPDSLVFISSLKQKNLRIQHYGTDNYARINAPFIYDAYDKDRFIRKILVGPENPNFTPIAQMSPYLAQSVLQAEDPSFMQHRGFLADAFRESIAKNYKERRFARGGSTISMQLVKNVFLSRDKTVSRKAEEALIVYLIENLGLVPKERMLEVYLNVIEWGPNVYGIGEAAAFYFNKKPSQLTLPESLFLASLIPHPKSFQYQFDKTGQLRSYMDSYFKILSERMVWRGVLNPSDTVGLEPKVSLKGPAMHMVMPKDSIPEEDENEL